MRKLIHLIVNIYPPLNELWVHEHDRALDCVAVYPDERNEFHEIVLRMMFNDVPGLDNFCLCFVSSEHRPRETRGETEKMRFLSVVFYFLLSTNFSLSEQESIIIKHGREHRISHHIMIWNILQFIE